MMSPGSLGVKSVTSIRRAVFSATSQSSPALRRRKTSLSETRDVRRRSLSTNRLENLATSHQPQTFEPTASGVENLATWQNQRRLRSTSVENLATSHFGRTRRDSFDQNVYTRKTFSTDESVLLRQVPATSARLKRFELFDSHLLIFLLGLGVEAMQC